MAKTDGPSSKLASSRLSYVEYIQTSIGFWETYHHHKEQMAYVASALFLTGAVATTILDIRSLVAGNLLAWIALLGLVVVTVVAGWLFIFWQLRLRQTAASMLRACGLLLAQWLTRPPSPDDLDLEISPTGRPLTKVLWRTYNEVKGTYTWFESPAFVTTVTLMVVTLWGIAAIVQVFLGGVACLLRW